MMGALSLVVGRLGLLAGAEVVANPASASDLVYPDVLFVPLHQGGLIDGEENKVQPFQGSGVGETSLDAVVVFKDHSPPRRTLHLASLHLPL